jgi:hypothetical protein
MIDAPLTVSRVLHQHGAVNVPDRVGKRVEIAKNAFFQGVAPPIVLVFDMHPVFSECE